MGVRVRGDNGEHRALPKVRALLPGITAAGPTAFGQIKPDCVPILFVKTSSAVGFLWKVRVVTSGAVWCAGVWCSGMSLPCPQERWLHSPGREKSEGEDEGLAVTPSPGCWGGVQNPPGFRSLRALEGCG